MSGRPKICQMVPTTFHGISSGSARITRQTATRPALARHRQRHHDAERHLDRQDDGGEQQVAAERGQEAPAEIGRGIEQFLEPADAVPEELVVAERVLHRIVHDRHQRQDRGERDHQEHRQHQEPGLLVDRSCPSGSPLDQTAVGIDVDMRGIEHAARPSRPATENPGGTRAANLASPMRTRAKRTRPRSSMRSIVADSRPDAGAATCDEFRAHADLDVRAGRQHAVVAVQADDVAVDAAPRVRSPRPARCSCRASR